MISLKSFIKAINIRYREYQLNPVSRTATIEQIAKIDIYANPDYDQLNYRKGLLLALLMDLEIRKRTQGQSTLMDFMKIVVKRFSGPEYYNNLKLQQVAESMTKSDWEYFFVRYVKGAELVPVANYFSVKKRRDGIRELDEQSPTNIKTIESLIH